MRLVHILQTDPIPGIAAVTVHRKPDEGGEKRVDFRSFNKIIRWSLM